MDKICAEDGFAFECKLNGQMVKDALPDPGFPFSHSVFWH